MKESDVLFGRHPVIEILKTGKSVNKVLLAKGIKGREIEEIKLLARKARVPFIWVDRRKLKQLSSGKNHQGVLAFIPTTFDARFWTIGSVLFLFALPIAVIDVVFITSIQLLVPKDKLGRVIAAIMAIAPAIRPLGQFLSGVIAEFIGIQLLFIIASATGIVVVILLYLVTPIKHVDKEMARVLNEANGNGKTKEKEEKFDEIVDKEDLNKKDAHTLSDAQIAQGIAPE